MPKFGLKSLLFLLCVGMIACSKKSFRDLGSPEVPATDEIIDTSPGNEDTLNNDPGSTSPNTPGNNSGNTPGNNSGNTPGNNSGNTPGNNSGTTPDPDVVVCEDENGTTVISKPVKVLFVVDKSGSNETGNGPSGIGSDPNKTFRYNAMNDFYQQHRSKPNLSWGFISFNDKSAKAFINKDGNLGYAQFSNSSQDMENALGNFNATKDAGGTPYKAALEMVENVIEGDIALSSVESDYLVAFVTDGVPSDYCVDTNETICPDNIDEERINQDLTRVLALAPSRIQFGTVYYGPQDVSAENRLARMASMGGGQFVNTNIAGSTMALNDVITVPKPNCP
ncbi:MAG: hypothetical protein AB7O96_16950 [Pseudobdellovibrionaceae bacterium]